MKIIEKKPQLKYPYIPYGNRFYYLLLHLAVPVNSYPPSTAHLKVAKKVAHSLGIKLNTITINVESNKSSYGTGRYLFHFPYFRRDDQLATRFADAILIAASVTFGPFLGENDVISCFRVPKDLIKDREEIYLGELVQSEETRSWNERLTDFPALLLGSSSSLSDYSVELAWKLTPLLFSSDDFLRAYSFIKTSQENFYVWPGQFDEVVDNAHSTAASVFEQSRLENALQDSFKAIEAILGDPPKNNDKFFRKIEAIGIDPNMKFGLNDEPIYQVIRAMSDARDKKAAHGSTSNRLITIGEMLVFQNCAHLVVLKASEKITGIQI